MTELFYRYEQPNTNVRLDLLICDPCWRLWVNVNSVAADCQWSLNVKLGNTREGIRRVFRGGGRMHGFGEDL